jgi:hypothetical protein
MTFAARDADPKGLRGRMRGAGRITTAYFIFIRQQAPLHGHP